MKTLLSYDVASWSEKRHALRSINHKCFADFLVTLHDLSYKMNSIATLRTFNA